MKSLMVMSGLCALCASSPLHANHDVDPGALPHLRDDINRDFTADVVFRGGSSLAYRTLSSLADAGVATSDRYAGDAGAGYTVVAVGDFDGDRSADVLWGDGSHLKLWVNDGLGQFSSVVVGSYGGGWQPFAAADINADGRVDLLFRGGTHLAYWLMDGARVLRSSYAGDGGAGYHVVAVADFTGRNADRSRSADVLWTNGSQLKMWVSDATTASFVPYAIGSYGGGWEPFAGGDVDGDGIADILFRGATHVAYWRQRYADTFGGFDYVSAYAGDGGPGYRAIGVSNYTRLGEGGPETLDDILWTNGSQLKLWVGLCQGGGPWDYDRPANGATAAAVSPGCAAGNEFHPVAMQGYGGGWTPQETLIPGG